MLEPQSQVKPRPVQGRGPGRVDTEKGRGGSPRLQRGLGPQDVETARPPSGHHVWLRGRGTQQSLRPTGPSTVARGPVWCSQGCGELCAHEFAKAVCQPSCAVRVSWPGPRGPRACAVLTCRRPHQPPLAVPHWLLPAPAASVRVLRMAPASALRPGMLIHIDTVGSVTWRLRRESLRRDRHEGRSERVQASPDAGRREAKAYGLG